MAAPDQPNQPKRPAPSDVSPDLRSRDPREAAAILGVSYWTVLDLMKAGQLGHYTIGSKKLTTDADLAAFQKARRVR